MTESTFTYNADRSFIGKVAKSQMTPALRKLNMILGALAAVVAASLVARLPLVAMAAGIGMVIVVPYLVKAQKPARDVVKAMRAQFGALPEPRTISVTVGETGVTLSNALGSQEVPWDHIASIHQTRSLWWIHTADGVSLPIPTAAIPPDAAGIMTASVARVTSDA
jgi:hypothetical protein